jgi:hypothetical protein
MAKGDPEEHMMALRGVDSNVVEAVASEATSTDAAREPSPTEPASAEPEVPRPMSWARLEKFDT